MVFQSTKIIDGFSTCFRQWRAVHSHCSFLHGYSISFKIVFEADCLDEKNWVEDFAFTKQNYEFVYNHNKFTSLKDWFSYMFDHTTVISKDDPNLQDFYLLHDKGVLDLRVVENVGCERFAELVYLVLQEFLDNTKKDLRVQIKSVECIEHSKNSAIITKLP